MRRQLDLIGSAILATIVFAALLVFRAFGPAVAIRLYLLTVCAIVLAGTATSVRRSLPLHARSAFDTELRRATPPPKRPQQLEQVERYVTLGTANAFDFHTRLRPVLREAAAGRLARRRGIDLDSPAGRAAVGEDAWALLRPDRPAPTDRHERGIGEDRLREIVEILDTL